MTYYIHLVGAESGGVGKTTFCKLLLEFLMAARSRQCADVTISA
jgi:broad-specificity NMP kinase